ncbi:pyridoxamine 5'-phosphate oxidase family protein [Aquimarina sp. M1]
MSKKDVYHNEALDKLKKLAESIDFAMLGTNLNEHPIHMVPMSTKKVDKGGTIWFLSGKDSDHNQHIIRDAKVHLIYSNPKSFEFLNVYGEASIHTEQHILNELYGSGDDAWFDGVEDPNLTAIAVKTTDAFYWDSKNSVLVSLVKMGVSAITGNEPDVSEYGELKV